MRACPSLTARSGGRRSSLTGKRCSISAGGPAADSAPSDKFLNNELRKGACAVAAAALRKGLDGLKTGVVAELEKVQRDLSLTRVEIKKHEKLGHKKSIDHLRSLVAEMSALSQRLNETSLENIDPTALDASTTNDGIRRLIRISNEDIDRICTQAATFASNDHVDVSVRQQLATMLFDNAEMRKQLNAYTEGILLQTMERLAVAAPPKALGAGKQRLELTHNGSGRV